MIKILLATIMSCFSIGFADEASKDWNDELKEAILANESEVVDHYEAEKIYVKPDKINPTPQGIYLNLNENEFIFVPTLRSDSEGCYIQVFDILPTCPGCGATYLYGDCGKSSCPEYQRRQQNTDTHKKQQQEKKDNYKREKDKKKKH